MASSLSTGANTAIADALELAAALVPPPASPDGGNSCGVDTPAALRIRLAAWEKGVVARGQSIAKQSTGVTGMIHAQGWVAVVRPYLLRVMGFVFWVMKGVGMGPKK